MTEPKPPSPAMLAPAMLDRYQGDDVQPLYTGRVRVSGGQAQHGRASGMVRSDDGALAVDLRLPPELGGPGGGSNPEQLLAASYAGCFHGAMVLVAARAGLLLHNPSVEVAVTFARDPADGLYLLSAEIVVQSSRHGCEPGLRIGAQHRTCLPIRQDVPSWHQPCGACAGRPAGCASLESSHARPLPAMVLALGALACYVQLILLASARSRSTRQ